MKSILCISLSLTFLLAAGCQIVHVTDPQGKPVAWADVSTITQAGGVSNFPVKTDLMGNATLMMSQEAPGTQEWLEVRKEGYITRRILRPESGQVEVEIQPAPGTPKRKDAKTK